jgi:hypothetical protein
VSDDFEKIEAAWSGLSGRDRITLLVAVAVLGAGILGYVHREQLLELWSHFHVRVLIAAGVLIAVAIAVDVLRARRWVRRVHTPDGRAKADRRPLTRLAARVVTRGGRIVPPGDQDPEARGALPEAGDPVRPHPPEIEG